jgi:hypothetical protein
LSYILSYIDNIAQRRGKSRKSEGKRAGDRDFRGVEGILRIRGGLRGKAAPWALPCLERGRAGKAIAFPEGSKN